MCSALLRRSFPIVAIDDNLQTATAAAQVIATPFGNISRDRLKKRTPQPEKASAVGKGEPPAPAFVGLKLRKRTAGGAARKQDENGDRREQQQGAADSSLQATKSSSPDPAASAENESKEPAEGSQDLEAQEQDTSARPQTGPSRPRMEQRRPSLMISESSLSRGVRANACFGFGREGS